jgi:RNA polymerase-binding transcription factor DksA
LDPAEALHAQRQEIQARLRALDESFDDVVASIEDVGNDDEHDPDGATIAFERAQVVALRRDAHAQLAAIDAALARVHDGTYGTCQVCGTPIAPERLDALPATPTCVGCAS